MYIFLFIRDPNMSYLEKGKMRGNLNHITLQFQKWHSFAILNSWNFSLESLK